MKVLALDLSLTSTGWATNVGAAPAYGTYTPRGRGAPRLSDVTDWLEVMVDDVDLVVVEGYSYASRGRAIVSIGELGGVVRLWLYEHAVPFVDVPPACAKKLATGKGNAGKELVLVEAVKRLEYPGHSNDEADALWLLQAALVHYGLPGAVSLPKTHLKGLRKVEWPELELVTLGTDGSGRLVGYDSRNRIHEHDVGVGPGDTGEVA